MKRPAEPRALILSYHRITALDLDPWGLAVTPRHFTQHLAVLHALGIVVRLQELVQSLENGKLRSRSVVITFDDGYVDNLYVAKPLLNRYAMPATVFVVTDLIDAGREFWWDELERLLLHTGNLPKTLSLDLGNKTTFERTLDELTFFSALAKERFHHWHTWQPAPTSRHALYLELWERLQPLAPERRSQALAALRRWSGAGATSRDSHRSLNSEEILALADGGIIEVGAHTMTHSVLSRLPACQQRQEIMQSKIYLENLLGHTVLNFSYPYGGQDDYTAKTKAMVRDAGFLSACANFAGVVKPSTDRFELPRVYVPDVDGQAFRRLLDQWLS